MPKTLRYAGIDVAQSWLDVAIHGMGQPWRVTTDEEGIESLIGTLRDQGIHLVVLEATGGYEVPITAALGIAGIPVAVVNPRQVRDFARSLGKLTKPVLYVNIGISGATTEEEVVVVVVVVVVVSRDAGL